MIKKNDLPILVHLHKELKLPITNEGIYKDHFPKDFKEKFLLNNTNEEYDNIEIEFRRFANIFEFYEVGEQIDNSSGSIKIIQSKYTFSLDFDSLYKKEKEEVKTKKVELEYKETSLKLNKWLLKTKWLPHIISIISIIIAIITFIISNNSNKQLEKRIDDVEKIISKIQKK